MPSMPLFFWGDRDGARYRDTYFSHFPGEWRHGDWVTFHPDGACTISGRSDGTLNRGGVRMGTAEFYAVLDDPDTLPEVVDALVVHLEDPSGGVGSLLLFVCLDHGVELDEQLKSRIFSLLRDELSPRHRPDEIYAVPAVPYNLTGKRLEVPIKRILQGVPRAQALSEGAVRNPEAIDAFEALLSKC